MNDWLRISKSETITVTRIVLMIIYLLSSFAFVLACVKGHEELGVSGCSIGIIFAILFIIPVVYICYKFYTEQQKSEEDITKKERILCAAYKFKYGYRTPNMQKSLDKDGTLIENIYYEPHRQVFFMAVGWRHADIIYKYADAIDQGDLGGFMTSKGRYVDRKEAAQIAWEAGQTKDKKNFLYSEDIY